MPLCKTRVLQNDIIVCDISWSTCNSSLLSCSGSFDHEVDHTLIRQSFTIFQPYFWFRKQQECDNLHLFQGIVSLTYAGPSNNAVFLVSFLLCRTPPTDHVQCLARKLARPCLAQTPSTGLRHPSFNFGGRCRKAMLGVCARPCQNTWAPHYAAARNWLKSKGVSALTDRSGAVYCWLNNKIIMEICKAPTPRIKALNKQNITHTMYIEMENVNSNLTKANT